MTAASTTGISAGVSPFAERGIGLSAHYRKLMWQGKLPQGWRAAFVYRLHFHLGGCECGLRSASGARSERFAQCCKTLDPPGGSGRLGSLRRESVPTDPRGSACSWQSVQESRRSRRNGRWLRFRSVLINKPSRVRFPANRTLSRHRRMTESDPLQTSTDPFCCDAQRRFCPADVVGFSQ
jgi:hypothetical protein